MLKSQNITCFNFNLSQKQDLVVSINENNDEEVSEPVTLDYRLTKATPETGDVLSSISGVLLYIANNSSKSCAEILSQISDPISLYPILDFLSRHIRESQDQECQKELENYLIRLEKEKFDPKYSSCICILQKSAPDVIKEKISQNIKAKLTRVDNFESLQPLLTQRLALPDTANEECLPELGDALSRLVCSDWLSQLEQENHEIDEIIAKLRHHLPHAGFQTVFTSFTEKIFSSFSKSLSTQSFAAILAVFERFKSESASLGELDFLVNVFDKILGKFDIYRMKKSFYPLLALVAKCFVFENFEEFKFPTDWFLNLLLVQKISKSHGLPMSVNQNNMINLNQRVGLHDM